MNDYISRKWLLECVEEGWIKFDTEKDKDRYIHLVMDVVPSADVPHWIPCSERMPETSDEVLTTYIVNGNTKKRYVETATWWADNSDEGGCWTSVYDEYRKLGTRIERIAWMPLPEPYKEGEQNDG